MNWSRLAGLYDWQLALERPALRTVLDMVAIVGSDRVLDVATGTGAVPRELARRGTRPARAVGVDASGEMLARARRALPPSWELERADAGSLPFEDAGFDAVTCAYLLHLLAEPERGAILEEIHRVLEPGGRLGVVTIAPPRTSAGRVVSLPVRAAARRSAGALAGLRPHDPRGELRAAGFEVSRTVRVRRGYPSLCIVANRGAGRGPREARAAPPDPP